MCGIAGVASPDISAGDVDDVRSMTECQRHRGPDSQNVWVGDNVVLGNSRLRIIGSPGAGGQPMVSQCGRFVITYNGEIYNYISIKDKLRDHGCTFVSDTDTEVLLQGLKVWGRDILEQLRGMFAFALYDRVQETLLLGRDSFGIKPLYVFDTQERVVFASSVEAILQSKDIANHLNVACVTDFLRLQSAVQPSTLVKDVSTVKAGYTYRYSVVDEHLPKGVQKWGKTVSDYLGERQDRRVSAQELRGRIREGVRRRLVSDVDVGVFLSGGLDSSIVAYEANQELSTPCFSVVFEEADEPVERSSSLIANRLGADHTVINVSRESARQWATESLARQDLPSGDGVNSYIVSKAVSESGLRVAVSGLGADELFAGYPSFGRLHLIDQIVGIVSRVPARVREVVAHVLEEGRGRGTSWRISGLLRNINSKPAIYSQLRAIASDKSINEVLAKGVGWENDESLIVQKGEGLLSHDDIPSNVASALLEFGIYMSDVLLINTDQMGMASSLEVRVPFLDTDVMEAAGCLLWNRSPRATRKKRLLRRAYRARLPLETVERKKKGFRVPLSAWMQGPLNDFCSLALRRLGAKEVFDEAGLRRVWDRFSGPESTSFTSSFVWTLVSLSEWMRRTGVE